MTYERSKVAREEESAGSGIYDRVYDAPRPEIFFKATPSRTVGPNEPVAVRRDSRWNVPEPELALVINQAMELVGFTVGNDMSSRDIEGENPLYLPQAKVYARCCALGPLIALRAAVPTPTDLAVELQIARDGATIFTGSTSAQDRAPLCRADRLSRARQPVPRAWCCSPAPASSARRVFAQPATRSQSDCGDWRAAQPGGARRRVAKRCRHREQETSEQHNFCALGTLPYKPGIKKKTQGRSCSCVLFLFFSCRRDKRAAFRTILMRALFAESEIGRQIHPPVAYAPSPR